MYTYKLTLQISLACAMLTHAANTLYGFFDDKEICEKYGALLIKEAVEAMGATWKGQSCGSFGDFLQSATTVTILPPLEPVKSSLLQKSNKPRSVY